MLVDLAFGSSSDATGIELSIGAVASAGGGE